MKIVDQKSRGAISAISSITLSSLIIFMLILSIFPETPIPSNIHQQTSRLSAADINAKLYDAGGDSQGKFSPYLPRLWINGNDKSTAVSLESASTLQLPNGYWPKNISGTLTQSYYPDVAVDSQFMYVVWSEDMTVGQLRMEIFFEKVDRSGKSVVNNKRLTNAYLLSMIPRLAVDPEGNMHIVWVELDYHLLAGAVYYQKFDSNGYPLTSERIISIDRRWGYRYADYPQIAVDRSGNVHVVWIEYDIYNKGYPYANVYYEQLNNFGDTIINDVPLTSNSLSYEPSIATDAQGYVHVAWVNALSSPYDPISEIFYKKFQVGDPWHPTLELNVSNAPDNYNAVPDVAVTPGGTAYVMWLSAWKWNSWSDPCEIYYIQIVGSPPYHKDKVSANGASAFFWPSVDTNADGYVHMVWGSCANNEILYEKRDRYGRILIDDKNISNTSGPSADPRVAINSSGFTTYVNAVWLDETPGNRDIFATQIKQSRIWEPYWEFP